MTDEGDEIPGASPAAAAFVQGKRLSYVKTQKGLLLSAEVVLSLIILICFWSSWSGCIGVPIVMLISSVFILGAFATGLDKRRFTALRWAQADLCRAAIGAVLYLVSSMFVVFKGYGSTVGAAFGIISVIVFAYDAYTTFLQLGRVRQQQRNYTFYKNILPT